MCVFACARSRSGYACSVCFCLRALTLCTLTLCMLCVSLLTHAHTMHAHAMHAPAVHAQCSREHDSCPYSQKTSRGRCAYCIIVPLSLSHSLSLSLSLSLSFTHTHTHTRTHTHTYTHTHQGKFQLVLLPLAGHAVHEDEATASANHIRTFLQVSAKHWRTALTLIIWAFKFPIFDIGVLCDYGHVYNIPASDHDCARFAALLPLLPPTHTCTHTYTHKPNMRGLV